MITIPFDDPLKPSKVFVIEVSQPLQNKGNNQDSVGVLMFSVDGKLASGRNSVVVYPKDDSKKAPFQPGDRFERKDEPMNVKVMKKNEDGRSYIIEVEVKK